MSSTFINIPDNGYHSWKKPVEDASHLPLVNNQDGDARVTLNDESIYLWDQETTSWKLAATPAGAVAIDALLGDVSAVGPGSVPATVNFVGGVSAADVASGSTLANDATSSNTPDTIVKRDGSGNFSAGVVIAALIGNVTGNVSGSSASFTGPLSGDVTGTQSATAISSPTVTAKLLTGLVAGSNTSIVSTDSILIALEKLQAQSSASSGSAITALTGDATATGPGSVPLTLATVNGSVGSFGSSTSIPNFTVNAKGLITAAGSNVVIAPAGTLTGATLAANVLASSLTSVGTLTSLTISTPLGISSGGTGSATQNFVDLTTTQSVAGDKSFTGNTVSKQLTINGTAGAGYIEYTNQSVTPATPVGAFRIFSDSTNRFTWIGVNGFTRTLSAPGLTANRIYTLPNFDGTVVLTAGQQSIAGGKTLVPVALIDAANIATDVSLGNTFTVTLGGNRNLSAPTNPIDGQKVIWIFTQDGTGNRTLTFDVIFDFGNLPTLILSSAAAKKDYMGAIYNSGSSKWNVVAYSQAF